jgi:hypothetical protein
VTLAQVADSGAAAGLVPSINNGETGFSVKDLLVIDKLESRCTRLRKNLGIAAKSLSRSGGRPFMLTLTYRRAGDWKPEHIKNCLQNLRKWLFRAFKWKLPYLWVMEAKKRLSGPDIGLDAPHYHLIVWVPHGVRTSQLKLDSLGWWPHGMTNALMAVAPVRYVMKYASKFDSEAAFPKGARCYGIGGLDHVWRCVRRWVNWPAFVQARASVTDSYKPQVGGGWVNRVTGEWFPAEFGLSCTTKRFVSVVRLFTHPKLLQNVAGPFSWAPGWDAERCAA